MASKNIIYKVNGKPTKQLVDKYNNDSNIFFRFQDPHQKLTSRSCSWGMIYSSKTEAIRDYKEMGLDPEDAILNGKSCMDTLEGLSQFTNAFDNSYVCLVFAGKDTYETGHDGEYVATYYNKVEVWSFDDVLEYINNSLFAEAI